MTALIAGYARTPFSRFNGRFASIPATALGAHAITAALRRAGVTPTDVQYVIAGHVLQAGTGQNPARQSAVGADIPLTIPALTLNAVCLSGMEAVVAAERMISGGEADIVVAVGQESMSLAPHVFHARAGQKYGALEVMDTLELDGLTDAFERRSMGISTEDGNTAYGLDRTCQDAWAAASHQRADAHTAFLAGEIEPYTVVSSRGNTVVADDDGVRTGTTTESLASLRTAFGKEGTITAGNSSQITDGAAALVLVSESAADQLGLSPLARVESHALVAGPDVRLHDQPANAILAALRSIGAGTEDLTAVEINEAFAAVSVQSVRTLGVSPDIVNTRGGAIALGHPIGASGARIVGTLARQLVELGPGRLGAAAICGGGGQGSAIVLRSL
ncbi:acetyl-CoA acetyltransferase [Pseudarthrobacter sulfonivorans]|uniref:Probable acetyl-CoA acetyltransferase n=1 Tax=Pseudarthrobacter sulfonivorans TaxID=121292 RepID=A0A0U3FMD1_9MICC|nr:acetyl-CoA C-acyltransferase [Pseudarthrobacter sulfonivorans]ALV40007.1 acetyl-CoA acetyltransferase [Pseudarthrobacter sulfonivorans]